MKITNEQLSLVLLNMLTNPESGVLETRQEFERFMDELIALVFKHGGGGTASPSRMSDTALGGMVYESLVESASPIWIAEDETDPVREKFSGVMNAGGELIRAEFEVDANASIAERDHAFVLALEDKGVVFSYSTTGRAKAPAPPSYNNYVSVDLSAVYGHEHPSFTRNHWAESDEAEGLGYWEWVSFKLEKLNRVDGARNIFVEALEAKSIDVNDPNYIGGPASFTKRCFALAVEILRGLPQNEVFGDKHFEEHSLLRDCLLWIDPRYEFQYWKGHLLSDFMDKRAPRGASEDLVPAIQYITREVDAKTGAKLHVITVGDMRRAKPLSPSGWQFDDGLTLAFANRLANAD